MYVDMVVVGWWRIAYVCVDVGDVDVGLRASRVEFVVVGAVLVAQRLGAVGDDVDDHQGREDGEKDKNDDISDDIPENMQRSTI